MRDVKSDAVAIFREAVAAVLPDEAVKRALSGRSRPTGKRLLVAIGKASWRMARAAFDVLGGEVDGGVVVTKYGHAQGSIGDLEIVEAGHPVPDDNSIAAAERVLVATKDLSADDEIVFLVSGGASALFEKPLEGVSLADMAELNRVLLSSGANIGEINALRKRFSSVKAGRFAQHCSPAKIFQIVLSDVVGDRLDVIASGPACADAATAKDAEGIAARYGIVLTEAMKKLIRRETPKILDNVDTRIAGNVGELCRAASRAAGKRGYTPYILTTTLDCEAREAGRFIAAMTREAASGMSPFEKPCALILGGETVVHVGGGGVGGRNQELALAAAEGIGGLENAAILSAGSDGTDGPTDAAGGVVDGGTWGRLAEKGMDGSRFLDDNDSYNALAAVGALVETGPTGTNVNDLAVALIGL